MHLVVVALLLASDFFLDLPLLGTICVQAEAKSFCVESIKQAPIGFLELQHPVELVILSDVVGHRWLFLQQAAFWRIELVRGRCAGGCGSTR